MGMVADMKEVLNHLERALEDWRHDDNKKEELIKAKELLESSISYYDDDLK